MALSRQPARAGGTRPAPSSCIGTFVGSAADELRTRRAAGAARHRDGDRGPTANTACRLQWNNVTLVDGRRDVPGRQVPPRRGAAGAGARPVLLPGAASATTRSPNEETVDPIEGDPLRWGVVGGRGARLSTPSPSSTTGPTSCRRSRRHPTADGVAPRVRAHRRRRGRAAHDRPRGPGRVDGRHGAGRAGRSWRPALAAPALRGQRRPGRRGRATSGSPPAASPAPTIPWPR